MTTKQIILQGKICNMMGLACLDNPYDCWEIPFNIHPNSHNHYWWSYGWWTAV